MGRRNDNNGTAATADGSIEVMLMEDGWTPIVMFNGGDVGSFRTRVENNVAWMLQTLLDSGSRVDTLFEVGRRDYSTLKEAKARLGTNADITVAHITGRAQRWQNVRAVGANGKRSHIFGLILALGMTGGYSPTFRKELEKYGLTKGLLDLVDQLEELQKIANGSGHTSQSSKPQEERNSRSRNSSRASFGEDSGKHAKRNGDRQAKGKGSGKRSPARRSPARRSPVKRSPARRSPARRSPPRPSQARRSPPKLSPAQRSPQPSPSRGDQRRRHNTNGMRSWEPSPDAPRKLEGIELRLVCTSVPVLTLSSESPVTMGCMSELLAEAMAQQKPADKLLEYLSDTKAHPLLQKVERACERELDLRRDQISIVKVVNIPLTEVLGVGASGRLSTILAAIIALALRDEGQLEDIRYFFEDKYQDLELPFYDLINRAVRLKESASNAEADSPEDDYGDLPTEASAEATWDPYMAAEAGVWNRASTRSARHSGDQRPRGRDKRRIKISRSRSGRRG